jgi:1-aminocyclopropane-1-carboxylate deaminase/D-cysteine desulfhydrase-like pyridoxal-dependent ACC family enzyme
MKMAGADLIFVDHADVSDAMDQAMEDLRNDGFEPYYIWGGGHNIHGMLAYYEAVKEVERQLKDWNPDYVIHASGTGGTQTGLHVGFEELYSETKVIGISVAREKGRGERIVEDGVKDLRKYLGLNNKRNEVIFLDDWTNDGYGSIYPDLVEGIKKASKYGFITDPVYTGKALLALSEMCSEKTIEPNSKVLFWHTGGLANLYNDYQSFI